MANENNEKRKWGRRAKSAIACGALLTISYYVCLFKGMDLTWFSEYAKYFTYILGFVVGGLTATDLVAVMKK